MDGEGSAEVMMSDKKRICLVIPSLSAGGMERVMSELANYFSGLKNLEVHLVIYGKADDIFYPLAADIKLTFSSIRFNDSFRVLYTIQRLWFLRKTILRIKPDTVLSLGEYWNNFVLLALIGASTPVYVSDRCKPDKKLMGMHNWLRQKLYPKAAGLVVQTRIAKEIYAKIVTKNKIATIGNPIRILSRNPLNLKGKKILMISRLITTKHHDRLLSIFAKLDAPDWELIIVGGDSQKQQHLTNLQHKAGELQITKRTQFEGYQKNVEQYYNRASVFAFTSSSEGFPNVVGEALAAGLPVVSYDCIAGPSEMITDGENGFLVPVFDDELFKLRLQTLIDNEELRVEMGKKARESMKKFSVETIGRQYLDFILS